MTEKDMTLGTNYTRDVDPVGWFASEKLWDVRAYWDGSFLWTRGGNRIAAPTRFIAGLPKGMQLDGGIYSGRGGQEAARRAVQYSDWTGKETFAVYDAPRAIGPWHKRIEAAALLLDGRSPIARTVCGFKIKSREHLADIVSEVLLGGGEGVMIRNPKITRYETGRTANLLKIKNVNVL